MSPTAKKRAKKSTAPRKAPIAKSATSARAAKPTAATTKPSAKRTAAKKPTAVKPASKRANTGKHPTKVVSRGAAAPLARLRKVCFALPEVTEKEAWGTPTFRVRDKMFAMFNEDHHGDGRIAVWCKAALGMQEILIDADRERFFRPPYVGPNGWIGIVLTGNVDWDEVHALLADAWRMTAPPKLAALLPAPGDD